jgi:phosphatidylserine/phosphatidylglycerophosphate/cardiolipin synthase-like enzyme
VLTNGVGEFSPQYTQYFCWANRMNYVPVFYGSSFHFWDAWFMSSKPVKNTHVYEYHVKDVTLHKKVMIVDGKTSLVGSYNLGVRSDMGDYEMVIRLDSTTIASDLINVHKKDLQHSREISPEEACTWYFDPIIASLGEMQKRVHGLI